MSCQQYNQNLGSNHHSHHWSWLQFIFVSFYQEKHGPVAMIHVDAHMDVSPAMMGNKIAHGTPFRRAVEAGCLQGNLVWQIGIRGHDYDYSDIKYAKGQVHLEMLYPASYNSNCIQQ